MKTTHLQSTALALIMSLGIAPSAWADNAPELATPEVATPEAVTPEATASSGDIRPVRSTLTLQMGQGQTRDTYLTPLLYEGPSLTLRYDRWRRMRHGHLTAAQTLSGTWIFGTDRGDHGDTWAARIGYRYALHFGLLRAERYTLLVGPYAGMETGFNYNLKLASANNPATFTENITLGGLSMAAALHYHLGRHQCQALLSLQTPLIGLSAITEYGASYYETYALEDYDGDVCSLTSLHNRQDLDVRLTTDIPLAIIPGLRTLPTRLNIGLQYTINTMQINHLTRRFSTTEFVIGWTYEHIPYNPNRRDQLSRTPINPW